jgi:CRP/FNR family cyclic AMP-dependent transcriptional regulator
MNYIETSGWLASGFVLLAFTMTAMIPLRISALCGNLAFIAYGQALGLKPVLALHVALLPINAWRLWQEYRRASTAKYNALATNSGKA